MKLCIFSLCLFVVSAAAFTTHHKQNLRHRRDAPDESYLPPAAQKLDVPADSDGEIELPAEPTAVLDDNGYAYRTVRLRYRQRRDVSHLNRGYLPPVVKEPSTEYLPPLPPAVKKAEPVITKEYLPPAPVEAAPAEEAPVAPLISKEYLPPTVDAPTEPPTEAPEVATEPEPEPTTTEAPIVESAVLLDDGYHYRQPEVEPDLSLPTREYLPPLEEGVVVAEGPAEDTAVLAEDGYHYRAIKRVRF